jgi:hypothetical protein
MLIIGCFVFKSKFKLFNEIGFGDILIIGFPGFILVNSLEITGY